MRNVDGDLDAIDVCRDSFGECPLDHIAAGLEQQCRCDPRELGGSKQPGSNHDSYSSRIYENVPVVLLTAAATGNIPRYVQTVTSYHMHLHVRMSICKMYVWRVRLVLIWAFIRTGK